MSLTVVASDAPDPKREFIRQIILRYRNEHKRGNGHLGVTLDELATPFNRHFDASGATFSATIKAMLAQRQLVLVYRRYKTQNEGIFSDRYRKLAEVRLLQEMPTSRRRQQGRLCFYLPDSLPRRVKGLYAKDVEVDQIIREILHPGAASVA